MELQLQVAMSSETPKQTPKSVALELDLDPTMGYFVVHDGGKKEGLTRFFYFSLLALAPHCNAMRGELH
jgi:hypothetical protein